MNLSPTTTLHGFTVLEEHDLPEISGSAYVMRHDKSGARLLYLRNSDIDKAFAIGFRTPPQDDTGVFHILEHSVLCGSDKFPVKEPFVNLLKSSMQTFLNAMTFPDKTLYPVASTNEQDLFNLMDVYLDAVFHPAIYRKRAIFEQEGWHYELHPAAVEESAPEVHCDAAEAFDEVPVPSDGDRSEACDFAESPESGLSASLCAAQLSADQTELVYNGVVFNEMKGALSDSSSVLFNRIQAALFPDTAYAFESGGTPHAIPTLTYEQYLDEHRRHYRLDNSYTVLYGDLDIERALTWLDKRYFSPVADEQAAFDAARAANGEAPLEPRNLALQQPIETLDIVEEMETAPENAVAACAYVIGTAHDRTRIVACDILLDALLGSNEAPLKRALLDADLADDISAFIADGLYQPFAVIQLKRQREDALERFVATFERELNAILDEGLDANLIEASLSRSEFVMREHDFGVSDGVALAMSSLSGWLYDDQLSCTYLRYDDVFQWLRAQLDGPYFSDLARSVFLQNNHRASVEVKPVAPADVSDEAQELAEKNASLRVAERERIVQEEQLLRDLQTQPDSLEAQATLPHLAVSDIGDAPAETPLSLDTAAPLPCLRHHIDTRGIAYVYRYFDARNLAFEDLPYLSILSLVLGKLGTSSHTAAEIDTLTQGKLGNLSFYTDLFENRDSISDLRLMFCVSSSALEDNVAWLATLPREVLVDTDYSDTARIKDLLLQRKIALEQSFAGAGHLRAMARARSYHAPSGVVMEHLSNVEFYRFLKDLLAHYDERARTMAARLQALACRLFTDDHCTVSFTGSDAAYEAFWEAGGTMGAASEGGQQMIVPKPRVLNEAFIVPSDVTYTAQGLDLRLLERTYNGTWPIASRVLSYDYLWNEVRVKGGAYGVGFQATRAGYARFYSYRDPHIDETLARFSKAGTFLRTFEPTQTDMEGFVISSVASFDAPKKARGLIRKQDSAYFSQLSDDERALIRSEMVACNIEDLRSLADTIEQLAQDGSICTFGNKEIITRAKTPLNAIDLFNE